MIRNLYPKNWDTIARRIKREANWHCESCQRPCLMPGEDPCDFWIGLNWSIGAIAQAVSDERNQMQFGKLKRFELGVAHLNHNPPDCSRENLIALCTVCHTRMDLQAIGTKRRLKLERNGQLNLLTPMVDNDPAKVQLPIEGVI
jgi:hypothetical protein